MREKPWIFRLMEQYDTKLILFGVLVTGATAFIIEFYVVIPMGYVHQISRLFQAIISVGYFLVTTIGWVLLSRKSTLDNYVQESSVYGADEEKK